MLIIDTSCLCSPGPQHPFAGHLLCVFQHFVSLIAHFSDVLVRGLQVCCGEQGGVFIALGRKNRFFEVPAAAAGACPAVSGACGPCSLPNSGQTALEPLIHCGGEGGSPF